MAEKRKSMRFEAILDAFQIHDMVLGVPEKIKSRIKDISRGGLRLFTENLLPKGSSVKLEMNIPGDNFPLFTLNEVMWSRKTGESGYETGVRFTDIKKEDKSRLLDYVYAEWRKFIKHKPAGRV